MISDFDGGDGEGDGQRRQAPPDAAQRGPPGTPMLARWQLRVLPIFGRGRETLVCRVSESLERPHVCESM